MGKRMIAGRRSGRRRKKFLSVLGCVVVFCTTYALILPAITMENTPLCGYEAEHEHNENCYTKELICQIPAEPHVHSPSCYRTEEKIVCGLPHQHTEDCYSSRPVLNCTEEHEHTDACWGQESYIACGLEETEGHAHGEGCFAPVEVLACGREEGDVHEHTAECFTDKLVCTVEPHMHTLACYSDRTAGVETAEDWEATLPSPTGNPAEDMAAIARSQLDYRSITANYIVLDEEAEEKAYYNRYAAWYDEEDPYCAWNSLFAAFCMHYANVENDAQLFSVNAGEWRENLYLSQLLRDSVKDAGRGDVLFFENEEGETLVSVVTDVGEASLTAIAGDILTDGNRTVAEMSFASDAPGLLGFFDVEDLNEAEAPAGEESEAGLNELYSSWPVVGRIIEKDIIESEAKKPRLLAAAPRKLGAEPLPGPGRLDIADVHEASMYWKPADGDPTVNDDWTLIDGSTSLEGNEHIKLIVNFVNLSPTRLKNNEYKMHFTLPAGLERCETTGTLTIGSRIVATLSSEADHRHVTIAFDEAWVDSLGPNATQEGNFYITAEFDHSALDNDDDPTITIGGTPIHVPVDTTDILAKYGQVSLTKALAGEAFVGEDGKYYLTYTLTVEAGEHGAQEVTVRDIFADTSNITAINGVSSTEVTANGDGTAVPKDERVSGTAADSDKAKLPGTVNKQTLPTVEDESVSKEYMVWNLGDMGPSEVRKLTYTVQLSDEYTSTYHGTDESLDNTAQVFSKIHPRNTDSAHYVSKTDVNVSKSITGDVVKTGNGTYLISYQLEISAPGDNDFPVKNVTIDDSFLNTAGGIDEWVRYDEDSFKLTVGDTTTDIDKASITFRNNGRGEQRGDSRASFSKLPVGDMEPGQTKVVTYTAELAEEAFAQTSGAVRVDNTAVAYDDSKPDRKETSQSRAWTDVSGIQWSRKFVGETLAEGRTETMNGESFALERGALKYEVIVNESGDWNMNDMTIVDAAISDMLKIVGNVRVDAYLVDENNRPPEGANNAEALAKLTSKEPDATKWITGTNGTTGFTQQISALGFDTPPTGKNYAYVLTYYAEPDESQMGSSTAAMISVGNNLTLSGRVGKGGKVIPVNTTVTSTTTVSNPNIFNVKKTAWYYEKPGEGLSGYVNGALYWVVRVDGNRILQGLKIQDSSNLGDYKNFNHDGKDGSAPAFVGAFVGSLGADESGTLYELKDVYPDAAGVLNSISSDGRLRELEYEIVNGENQGRTAPVEIWYGGNITNDNGRTPAHSGGGVEIDGTVYYNHDVNFRFRTDYDITPGESIYIIFRTEPMIVPQKGSDTYTFKNKINYNNGTGWVDLTNQAPTQTLYGSDGIQKTVTYPMLYFVEAGSRNENAQQPGSYGTRIQGSQGPYAIDHRLVNEYLYDNTSIDRGFFTGWNIRVNQEGKLSGTYRVKEILPEGMELAYLRLAGRGAGTDEFTFKEISGLESEGWIKHTYTPSRKTGESGKGNNGSITPNPDEKTEVIYYQKGNEVIFELSSFKANGKTDEWADIQVITHVTDEKATQGQATDFENRTQLLDLNNRVLNSTAADVTLALSDMIDKSIATGKEGSAYNSAVLPFRLQVNDFLNGTEARTIPDLNPDGTTVNLVDEMSNALIIDPDSVRIYTEKLATDPWTDKTGPDPKASKLLTGYTVVITGEGHTMRIENLPDNQILTIFYNTTVNVAPGVSTTISNTAHWEGVATPSEGSSVAESFKYTSAGAVYPSPTLRIRKVDPSDAQGALLNGAAFRLTPVLYFDAQNSRYIAPKDYSQFQGDHAANLGPITGTTQNGSVLVLGAGDDAAASAPHLVYNTVYRLEETAAPEGYVLDSTPYYFIIAKSTGTDTSGKDVFPNYLEYLGGTELSGEAVYVSYGGPEYTYTAYNRKGEIEVTKSFGGNAEGGRPVEGTYYFALYDFVRDGLPLGDARYTASLTYTAADIAEYDSAVMRGEAYAYKYATFQNLPLNTPYYLFETDANGNAAAEGGQLNANGESFVVNYSFPESTTAHQLIPSNANKGRLQAGVANNRYQASVTKSFADVVGNTLSQGLVGTYDFGIWKADESGLFDFEQQPLDVQSVVFRIQDSNVSEKSAVFKGLLPGTYAIYELDENGKLLEENTSFSHSSSGTVKNDFIVHYTADNAFTIAYGDTAEKDVHAVNTSSVSLPMTGGIGTLPYQLGGALLISASLLAGFGLRIRKRKSDACKPWRNINA